MNEPEEVDPVHWLDSLSGPERERVLDAMRRIGSKADVWFRRGQWLAPRHGEVATGGEHHDLICKAEALRRFLALLRFGEDPEESASRAKEYARQSVAKWNANPRAVSMATGGWPWTLQRWEGLADETVEDALRQVCRALKGGEAGG